ncbi:MAG: hypothetical protein ACQETG_10135, partial [Thermodesulfobacteriota bacterium]
SIRDELPEKDRKRLSQWEAETGMSEFSESQQKSFEADFKKMITEQRYSLLLENQLRRLQATSADFKRWLKLNREIFSADADGADTLLKRIKQQKKQTEKIRSMINSTLSGASQQLKKEMRSSVDRFFDIRHGEVVPGIIDFISGYTVSYDRYSSQIEENGFAETLFAVFQDFKEQLDRYMAETVNPKLFRFARENENYIRDYFESIAGPYESTVKEAMEEFREEGAGSETQDANFPRPQISLDTVKKTYSIEIPEAAATLAYSSSLKTEAFMKLGLYRFLYSIKKLARRSQSGGGADVSALKSGVARMKRETEASIIFHFKNYRENLKFQYLFRLVDSVADEISEMLVHRFKTYSTDFERITEITGRDRADREKALEGIDSVLADLAELDSRLEELGGAIRLAG